MMLIICFPDQTVMEETGSDEMTADYKTLSPDRTLGGIHGILFIVIK